MQTVDLPCCQLAAHVKAWPPAGDHMHHSTQLLQLFRRLDCRTSIVILGDTAVVTLSSVMSSALHLQKLSSQPLQQRSAIWLRAGCSLA